MCRSKHDPQKSSGLLCQLGASPPCHILLQGTLPMPSQLLTTPKQPGLLPLSSTSNVWGVLTKPSTIPSFTTRVTYHVLCTLTTYDISGQKPKSRGSGNTSVQGTDYMKGGGKWTSEAWDRLQAPRTQNFYRQSRASHSTKSFLPCVSHNKVSTMQN